MCHLFPDLPPKQPCIQIPTVCPQVHKPGWMMLMDVYVSLDTIELDYYWVVIHIFSWGHDWSIWDLVETHTWVGSSTVIPSSSQCVCRCVHSQCVWLPFSMCLLRPSTETTMYSVPTICTQPHKPVQCWLLHWSILERWSILYFMYSDPHCLRTASQTCPTLAVTLVNSRKMYYPCRPQGA